MIKNRRALVLLTAVVLGIVAGLVVVQKSLSTGKIVPPATGSFGVFAKKGNANNDPALAEVASMFRGGELADVGRAQVLLRNLGEYDSRVIAVSSISGRTICFALAGETSQDPGAAYCNQPNDPSAPASIAGQHFGAMALYSAFDGTPRVQLFGIAFDDVAYLRINVAGTLHDVPLSNNGFYLDLPETQEQDVGVLEATLTDGTVQQHNMQPER